MCLNELNDPARAVQYLEQILAYDARDVDALSTLWPLYCEHGRHLDMFRTLDSLARAATNGHYAAHYLANAASWVEDNQLDLSVAFECWWRAHRLAEGTHETAMDRLEQLAESTGRWSDYIEALEFELSMRRARRLKPVS